MNPPPSKQQIVIGTDEPREVQNARCFIAAEPFGVQMLRSWASKVIGQLPNALVWAPRHRAISIDSEYTSNSRQYAREVIERFMTRAYRRPTTSAEVQLVMQVWQASFEENHNFYHSIKDALTRSVAFMLNRERWHGY